MKAARREPGGLVVMTAASSLSKDSSTSGSAPPYRNFPLPEPGHFISVNQASMADVRSREATVKPPFTSSIFMAPALFPDWTS
jgi:hypothetical protein